MVDLILTSAFYNNRATHVMKVRQILECDPEYITDRDNQGEVSITRVSLSKVLIIKHEKT